ncbi:MAG: beta-ketoacyl synthase N-terminal-like domain-containing protein, partial [Desulfobulbales bacterium]|nr:beta-ketoacyl synthase N-terminal-like domain-containing protein [Desulfobulbales bacterium]
MEKRDLKRIPVNLDASLHFNGIRCDAFIGNISENGLYTVLTNPADDGLHGREETDVLLSFNSPSGELIKLHCRKKWSVKPSGQNRTTRVGLELLNAQPEYTSFYQKKYYEIRNNLSRNAIAVVGMACHYPGSPDLQSFWENILARRREFRRIPDERMPLSEYYDPDPAAPDKTYATKAAVIDGFDFDWAKRGIPKSVIESSDIAHWLALEISLRALEDAGYSRNTVPIDRSGVILGNTLTGEHSRSENMRLRWPYVRKSLIKAASRKGLPTHLIDELAESMEGYYKSVFAPVTEDTLAGNLSNTIAGRICNFLNFNGGGYTVDGACSSSLIAVTTAATALSNGNMDLVIAGGVDISLDTFELIGFAKTNALTKDDMRVYDRHANGFIPGEGAGFVVLKRLEDARAHGNYIYSILRGWGISSDGKGGLTAPKAETQAIAIRRAYTQAGYSPQDVDFIEGHGTGTPAGDKAELEAISEAMAGRDNTPLRSCGVTSLKSIIGHTKAASGIGGFIKASLAVNRRVLPPTAGCNERNTVFEDKALSLYPILHGEIRSPNDILRAGVSGMGFGGINCHVTLESGDAPARNIEPQIAERKLLVSPQDSELFVFSADTPESMIRRVRGVAKTAAGISMAEMVDLARHLADEAADHEQIRAAIIASTPQDLQHALERCAEMLQEKTPRPGKIQCSARQDIWIGNTAQSSRVGFLFPGQGSQQLNMGRLLKERHPWAQDLVDRADQWLGGAETEILSHVIYQPEDRAPGSELLQEWQQELTRSDIAQPAICLSSLLWQKYLERLGITPVASGGHSLG